MNNPNTNTVRNTDGNTMGGHRGPTTLTSAQPHTDGPTMTALHVNNTRHSQAIRPTEPALSKRTTFQRLIARAGAITTATFLLPAALTACSHTATPPEQQGRSGATNVQMSGNYVIGDDGRLTKGDWQRTFMPKMDATASQRTEIGARAFAQSFVSFVGYAWNTGDTDAISQWCDSQCLGCQELIEQIDTLYESGGWMYLADYQSRQVIGVKEIPGREGTGELAVGLWVSVLQKDRYDGSTLYTNEKIVNQQWEPQLCPKGDSWKVCSLGIQDMENVQE